MSLRASERAVPAEARPGLLSAVACRVAILATPMPLIILGPGTVVAP